MQNQENLDVSTNRKNIDVAAAAKSLQSCPTLCEPTDIRMVKIQNTDNTKC